MATWEYSKIEVTKRLSLATMVILYSNGHESNMCDTTHSKNLLTSLRKRHEVKCVNYHSRVYSHFQMAPHWECAEPFKHLSLADCARAHIFRSEETVESNRLVLMIGNKGDFMTQRVAGRLLCGQCSMANHTRAGLDPHRPDKQLRFADLPPPLFASADRCTQLAALRYRGYLHVTKQVHLPT